MCSAPVVRRRRVAGWRRGLPSTCTRSTGARGGRPAVGGVGERGWWRVRSGASARGRGNRRCRAGGRGRKDAPRPPLRARGWGRLAPHDRAASVGGTRAQQFPQKARPGLTAGVGQKLRVLDGGTGVGTSLVYPLRCVLVSHGSVMRCT